MDVELAPRPDDPSTAAAVGRAVEDAGLARAALGPGAWWSAGLAETLEPGPAAPRPSAYEAVRSPRSTRGATRA
jgi:hypothetical protein